MSRHAKKERAAEWRLIESAQHKPVVEEVRWAAGRWRAYCSYCGWRGKLKEKPAWAQYDADDHRQEFEIGGAE